MTTWARRIELAIRNGCFRPSAKRLAGDWHTCKVGEEHRLHPKVVLVRDEHSQPKFRSPLDPHLGALGTAFSTAVFGNDVQLAQQYHDLIEARVKELTRRLHKR